MAKHEKRLSDLKTEIQSGDEERILTAIGNLRRDQPFRGAVELLADAHSANTDINIRAVIEKFFNDLKDPSLAPDIIRLIDRFAPGETRTALIASCWQSGTDYSPYLDYFVKWSLTADYVTVLECYTVIEQWAPSLTPSGKNNCSEILEQETKNFSGDTGLLLNEIRSLLQV